MSRPGYKKVMPKDKRVMEIMRERDWEYKDISKVTGFSLDAVGKHVKEITVRKKIKLYLDIKEMYFDLDMTQSEIANILRIAQSQVSYIMNSKKFRNQLEKDMHELELKEVNLEGRKI